MNTPTKNIRPSYFRLIAYAIALMAIMSPRLSFAQIAPTEGKTKKSAKSGETAKAASNLSGDETVELSPFIVDSSADRGYESNNTLSGTRLNTPSKYVGAAITDMSPALMADLGLTNMQDLINFTPNASSYFGGGINTDTNGGGGLATNPGASGVVYYVRGLSVTNVGRDFLNFRVPDDAYNLERFSFTRGPNSVLFGIGNPGGIVNSVSKQPTMSDKYQTSVRFDTNGSRRANFDLNKVIIKKKLAVRVAVLTENSKTNRKPSDRKADRLYGSVRYDLTPTTMLSVNGEQGRLNSLVIRPWAAEDGLAGWIAAGSQEIPANLANGGVTYAQSKGVVPQGQPSVAANTAQLIAAGFEVMATSVRPTILDNSSGYAPMPAINGNGLIYTLRPTLKDGSRNQVLINSPIPYTANVLGYGNHLVQNFGNFSINLNQRIGQNLFLQATFNRQQTNYINDGSSGGTDNITIDKNKTLLTNAGVIITNPNYNRYFTWNTPISLNTTYIDDQTARITASYELNLKEKVPGVMGKILGHHTFAGLRERVSADIAQQFAIFQDVSALISNPAGSLAPIGVIHYFTPGISSSYSMTDLFVKTPPIIFANDMSALPREQDATGIAPAWVANTSTRSLQHINSQMVVAQNFFLDDKIVTTFGARKDVSDVWALTSLNSISNGNLVYNAATRDVKSTTAGEIERSGHTYTRGVVVSPLPWIGLFYNRSDSFVPAGGTQLDIFGKSLTNGTGKGQDYGIKFSLANNKLSASISKYTTNYLGLPSTIFRGGAVLSLQTPMQAIGSAMYNYTTNPATGQGDITWTKAFPYLGGNQVYYGLNDVASNGYELSVTANPTPNWRITFNGSHQVTKSSNFGQKEAVWVETVPKAYFAAHPEYLGLVTPGSGLQGGNETIAQRLQDMTTLLSLAQSLVGKADARQAQYSFNFVTGYDITKTFLRGMGVGETFQWRQKMILGYPFIKGRTDLYDTSRPFYSEPVTTVGIFANYKFKVFGVRTRIQLNINGLTSDSNLHPYTYVDRGDGTPLASRYYVGPGRNYALTLTCDF